MQERGKESNKWRKKEESREERVRKTGRWVLEERNNGSKEREEVSDEIILQVKISLLIQQRCNMS